MLVAAWMRAPGCLLPVVFSLLLAPRGAFLRVEAAVVIGVDLVEPLVKELVALLVRHCCDLVVIGLTAFDTRPLRCGKARCRELPREACLTLLQIVQAKLAVLFEGDRLISVSRFCGALRGCWPLLPRGGDERGSNGYDHPWSHNESPKRGPHRVIEQNVIDLGKHFLSWYSASWHSG